MEVPPPRSRWDEKFSCSFMFLPSQGTWFISNFFEDHSIQEFIVGIEDVFPIENGDIPASHVSLPEGKWHQFETNPPG